MIRSYQQKTDKIRLFTIENGGVANARNVGIRQASGQYITFMDGDDAVEPDFYEKAVAELDRGGYDFVQGNYREVYEDRVISQVFVEQDMEIADREEMMRLFVIPAERRIYNSACNKVYRGDIARQVSFCPGRILAEDQEYNFQVLYNATRIKLLTAMSVDYYQRGNSCVHTMNTGKVCNKLEIIEHILEKNPYPELILPIEEEHVRLLQEYHYFLCKEKDSRAKAVRGKILACPIRQLWPRLTPNVRRRLLLYRFAGPLYEWYLSVK